MVRLIDAEALVKDLGENYTFTGFTELLNDFASAIRSQPTVDAVPVIRCKDCKWWKAEKEECYEWYDSPYAPADGYCFRAERKEE